MIDRIKQAPWVRTWLADGARDHAGAVAKVARRHPLLAIAVVACLLAVGYWGVVASDRYVSEAHVIIQRTDAGGQGLDFGAMLTGVTAGSRNDQMLLRDYLLSVDMLRYLDKSLNLRGHYSDPRRDPLSRLWSADAPMELLYRYYLSRVSVEYDELGGVLVVKVQAYTPEMAQAIADRMVRQGERYMNSLAHDLAREQVAFLEDQVVELGKRATLERQRLIALQNQRGMASPEATAETLTGLVNQLEIQLSGLRTRRAAMAGYLSPGAPALVEVDMQIAAVEQQMAREKARLAAPRGKALNSTVEEFQRQQMAADFATEVYKTALGGLEKGRAEAMRTMKRVSVLQSPTLPEYALQPQRLYNIVVSVLMIALLAGVLQLVGAIIRDHRD